MCNKLVKMFVALAVSIAPVAPSKAQLAVFDPPGVRPDLAEAYQAARAQMAEAIASLARDAAKSAFCRVDVIMGTINPRNFYQLGPITVEKRGEAAEETDDVTARVQRGEVCLKTLGL